ncbi:DUF2931 family protein [Stutzerimonas zhaodongensis]|uniref:DUF2931 family protein n=1 Tax=Stutzerimonas zhaodongensis TaxID=1176257 RepID=UPI001F4E3575|nr:DUF2931 family protein [Stutzerimonas zhaodongensis]UNG19049.1 DUF2931 family protein [Stutzerimonas zhaodongensis]
MTKPFFSLLAVLVLCGCQAHDPLSAMKDPKARWWSLEFIGPNYMTGWVESSVVQDIDGRLIDHGGGGVIGNGNPGYATETAKGWVGGVGSNTRGVVGAVLPKRIYVRWQSIVEPQTYRAWVDIPEQARELMLASVQRRCPETPARTARYMASMYFGLAPGGIVQVWVVDSCGYPVKVARAEAEVEPMGPSQGKTNGRYAYTINDKTRRYIIKYGIPYGSW